MIEYITKDGDRWDLLAYMFYADPYMYEPIVLANFQYATLPVLPAGLKLNIPIIYIENEETDINPPWITD